MVVLRRAGVVGALVLASLVPAGAHSAPPPLRISDPTVEATGPDGADATYQVKAFDPTSGNPLAATCDPPAGAGGSGDFSVTGHFPLGQTTVTCNTTTMSMGGPADSRACTAWAMTGLREGRSAASSGGRRNGASAP